MSGGMTVEIGTQELSGKLKSLVNIAQQKHIKLIEAHELEAVASLCGKCFESNGFEGEFDLDATIGTIQAIYNSDKHLAITWKENGIVLGVGLFLVVPSITSMNHQKLIEVAWDAHPDIDEFKKGRIMVSILNFVLNYYKGVADTAHFSVPCDNVSVRRYLLGKGFLPKEVCYVKELK